MAIAADHVRRARRHSRRRDEILDAAADVFARDGYDGATLESIGDAVGLSKTSLYYYVQSKEELFARLVVRTIEEQEAEIARLTPPDAGPSERLRAFIEGHMRVACSSAAGHVIGRNIDLLLGPAATDEMRAVRRRFDHALEVIIADGVADGAFAPVDPRTIAYLIFGSLDVVPRWHERLNDPAPATIAAQLASMVLGGLVTSGRPDAKAKNVSRTRGGS